MPDKGRRIASRQAQLGRRRRRQNRGPSGAEVADTQVKSSTARATEEAATGAQGSSNGAQSAPAVAPARPAATVAQPRAGRQRGERPTAYNYVAPELRRIMILGGVLSIVVVAAAFFI